MLIVGSVVIVFNTSSLSRGKFWGMVFTLRQGEPADFTLQQCEGTSVKKDLVLMNQVLFYAYLLHSDLL